MKIEGLPIKLIQLVAHYESLHDGDLREIGLQPKMCPAGYWTEGYGKLVLDEKGNPIKGNINKLKAYKNCKLHSVEEAVEALKIDLKDFWDRVSSLGLTLTDYQQSALTSFAYNVGFGALQKSSLLRSIKNNGTPTQIDINFRLWNKGGGNVLAGLTARRTSESLLFIKGELKFFN